MILLFLMRHRIRANQPLIYQRQRSQAVAVATAAAAIVNHRTI